MTLQEAIKYCKDRAGGSSEHKELVEFLEELLERRKAAAKFFGVSLDEYDRENHDSRDYEWLLEEEGIR